TTQSSWIRRGSGTSCRATGERASCLVSWLASSGTSNGSGATPKTSARTASPPGLELGHLGRARDEGVDVGVLAGHDRLHVGEIVLETVAGPRLDDPAGHLVGRHLGALVDGVLVVGQVPDLSVDRSRFDQLHRDPGAMEV